MPTTGIEPLPLRWETAIQPNGLWGMHKEISLKAMIYISNIPKLQSIGGKLTEILEQKCKSKYWSEYFKDEF